MSRFRQFLLRGNVVDLAVAVVIGSLRRRDHRPRQGLLTPLIRALVGTPDFSVLSFAQRQPVPDRRRRQRDRLVRADRRRGLLSRRRSRERAGRAPEPRRGAARSDDQEVSGVPERDSDRRTPVRVLHLTGLDLDGRGPTSRRRRPHVPRAAPRDASILAAPRAAGVRQPAGDADRALHARSAEDRRGQHRRLRAGAGLLSRRAATRGRRLGHGTGGLYGGADGRHRHRRRSAELRRMAARNIHGERLVLDFGRNCSATSSGSRSHADTKGTADSIYRLQYDAQSIRTSRSTSAPFVSSAFTLGVALEIRISTGC